MVKQMGAEGELQAQMIEFFGGEDFEEGEKQWLAQTVIANGITLEDIKGLQQMNNEDGGVGGKSMMTARQQAVWQIAAAEENKDYAKMSPYVRSTPKFPRSWVEGIKKLDHNQTHKFMFSGSSAQARKMPYRAWMDDFVATHFTDNDYFRVTDRASNRGAYDKTSTAAKGFRPKGCGGKCVQYDETYWAEMCKSKFVVAPGGDTAWSYRYYETFFTHAIPVINSVKGDWSDSKTPLITKMGFTHMLTSDSLEYNKEAAEDNYRKAIKYLTFIEGENEPEEPKA